METIVEFLIFTLFVVWHFRPFFPAKFKSYVVFGGKIYWMGITVLLALSSALYFYRNVWTVGLVAVAATIGALRIALKDNLHRTSLKLKEK